MPPTDAAESAAPADAGEGVWVSHAREQLRPLLKLNDMLRRLSCLEKDINVTTIVAVGDQSHGKSSVLEALSGVDLPRGDGIKTRVPLVLALRQATDGDEYAEIITDAEGATKRIKLSDVASAIEKSTVELAGGGKDVQNKPIELTVYRTDQDDLTLVDLPGMTRVAVDGQHDNIAETIRGMYRTYMEPEETIMLNVVSAMVDFSTSEALQLSRELDPNGDRTLLCVTKCDQHTEPGLPSKVKRASDQMNIPLQRIFCVRNRSQVENDMSVTLAATRKEEARFFSEHDEFASLPMESMGTNSLSKHLVRTQVDRIASTLPSTERKVAERLREFEEELTKLGGFPRSEAECRAIAHPKLSETVQRLTDEVDGRSTKPESNSDAWTRVLTLTVPKDKVETKGATFRSVPVPIATAGCTVCLESEFMQSDRRSAYVRVQRGKGVTELELLCSIEVQRGDTFPQCRSGQKEMKAVYKGGGYPWDTSSAGCIFSYNTDKGDFVITAHIDVIDVKQSKDAVQPERVLCSVLADLDDALPRAYAALYPPRTLLGPGFTNWITSELSKRRGGGGGLPGTIMPEVPKSLLQAMRERVPPVLFQHLSAVAAAARESFVAEVNDSFADFPRLCRALVDEVKRVCDEQEQEARQDYERLLKWETVIHTSNHYFMDTVKKVRAAIEVSREGGDEWSHSIAREVAKRLDGQGRSNEEQKVIDMQVEIYAYWKTMRKRLLDYAQSCARWTLVVNPVQHLLHTRLQRAVENAASGKGLLAAMAPDSERQRRFDQVSARKAKLGEAAAAIAKARVAWVGRAEPPTAREGAAA